MPRHDQHTGECLVFTEKEGLLSAIAHDLRLRVARWSAEWSETGAAKIVATFDAASLEVETAMKAGAPSLGALSDKDKRTIEGNIVSDVLHSKRFPEIRFESTEVVADGEGYRIKGDLTLHGQTREIGAVVRAVGKLFISEVTLSQPDFGITPYRAMMGTLKVRPEVRVRLALPRG